MSLLRAFNEVQDSMRQRTILAEESGVVYTHGDVQIVWAFEDIILPVAQKCLVTDVMSGKAFDVCGEWTAEGRRIYRVEAS